MSGIEVAGLVLGSLPLIIAALDKWRASAEVWDDWWQIKRGYLKCRQDLACAQIELVVNLERFLLPLVVDDDEIAVLMSNPGGPRWSEPHLDDVLKRRLPRSYDLFVATIKNISEVVDRIKDEVGINHADFVEMVDKKDSAPPKALSKWFSRKTMSTLPVGTDNSISKSFGAQAQRTRFAFRRKERDKLFSELSQYNRRLQTLLDTNEKSLQLTRSRDDTRKMRAAEGIFTLWRHAERIYELLSTSFRCQCKHLHRLHLRLCHQTACTRVEFSFQLVYSLLDSDKPGNRRAFTARRMETAKSTFSAPVMSPQPSPASAKPSAPGKSAIRQKGKMKASAETATTSASMHLPTELVPIRTKVGFKDSSNANPSSSSQNSPSIPLIDDVCRSMVSAPPDSEYIGMLRNQDAVEHEGFILLSPTQEIVDSLVEDARSLAELLLSDNKTRLTRQQRYRIALKLASSHVQLFSTPWLSGWQKSKILVSPGSSTELYMTHSIGTAATQQNQASAAVTSRAMALQSLGILLLELSYGVALEEHEDRKALKIKDASPHINAALDLAAAQQWATSVAGEAGERFADAVQWCLKGGGREEEQKRWRKEVWTNVVEPLQWSLEQFG